MQEAHAGHLCSLLGALSMVRTSRKGPSSQKACAPQVLTYEATSLNPSVLWTLREPWGFRAS